MRKRTVAAAVIAALSVVGYFARETLLLNAAVLRVNWKSADREKKLGFVTRLPAPPAGWLPIMRTDMDKAWEPLGHRGLNYFTFGAPDTLWSRYASHADATSPRYQAWFGVYVVEVPGEMPSDLPAFADALLSHDQLQWLKTMGDPDASATVAQRESHESIVIDGHTVPLWEGSVETHSDVGACDHGPRIAWVIGCPPARPANFHPISLTGFVAVWADPQRHAVFAAYGNGISSTWQSMRPALLELARGVHID